MLLQQVGEFIKKIFCEGEWTNSFGAAPPIPFPLCHYCCSAGVISVKNRSLPPSLLLGLYFVMSTCPVPTNPGNLSASWSIIVTFPCQRHLGAVFKGLHGRRTYRHADVCIIYQPPFRNPFITPPRNFSRQLPLVSYVELRTTVLERYPTRLNNSNS